jgi:hypothetical protein
MCHKPEAPGALSKPGVVLIEMSLGHACGMFRDSAFRAILLSSSLEARNFNRKSPRSIQDERKFWRRSQAVLGGANHEFHDSFQPRITDSFLINLTID